MFFFSFVFCISVFNNLLNFSTNCHLFLFIFDHICDYLFIIKKFAKWNNRAFVDRGDNTLTIPNVWYYYVNNYFGFLTDRTIHHTFTFRQLGNEEKKKENNNDMNKYSEEEVKLS